MIFLEKYIRGIVCIVIIILLLFLGKNWLIPKIITGLGGYTDKETEIKIETEYIKGDVDTVAVFNHYVKTKGIILNPKPKIVYRDKPSTEEDGGITSTAFKEFEVDISDTLITGIATITNNFNGNLEDLIIDYKPLFPKYITRTDTIRITKTITETLDNERAKIGIGVGYNSLNYPSVLAGYTTKNGWQFLGEYGKALGDIKVYQSGQTFFTPADDLISLKIIKNF